MGDLPRPYGLATYTTKAKFPYVQLQIYMVTVTTANQAAAFCGGSCGFLFFWPTFRMHFRSSGSKGTTETQGLPHIEPLLLRCVTAN